MGKALHGIRYPGESEAYRAARDALLGEELALRERVAQVAALRRALPPGGRIAEDYVFDEPGRRTRLSELFADGKDSLILYSFMFGPAMEAACPMCTSFLDGANAYARHVTQRANFAVVGRSPIARLAAWAQERGWDRLRLLSSANNTYNADYFAETPEGAQLPALNVFRRTPDGIFHFWGAETLYVKLDGHPRHVDLLWPIWAYFDVTPEGRGDFMPKLEY